MPMGSKPGYGPKAPPGTTLAGGRKVRHRSHKRRAAVDRATCDPRAEVHSSQPERPKVKDTNTNRRRGGSGTYQRVRADELVGRDLASASGISADPTATLHNVATADYVRPSAHARISRYESPEDVKQRTVGDAYRAAVSAVRSVQEATGTPTPRGMRNVAYPNSTRPSTWRNSWNNKGRPPSADEIAMADERYAAYQALMRGVVL